MGSFMRALSRSGWVDQRRAEGPRSCVDTLAGFTRNRLAAIHGATVPAPDRPARPSLAGRSAGHAAVPRERPRSEEHTSELQSLMRISYAVFCLKQKNNTHTANTHQKNIKHQQAKTTT